MQSSFSLLSASALAPLLLMAAAAAAARVPRLSTRTLWSLHHGLAGIGLLAAACSLAQGARPLGGFLYASTFGLVLAVLVQLLGLVIGRFSARYLQGEAGQRGYLTAFAAVLAAVHLLLLADHWVVLITAWSAVGVALQRLLYFYPDRPFALLAAHKKRLADRLADALLIAAAALAWHETGSGQLGALWLHVAREGMSLPLHASVVALVLAVALRTALLPVHGWLIQVMEAPTPVSALLHAGVVNLGGFVLIRFAPLLEQSTPARALLLFLGLATAVLAGLVMLTRISIKVRLAWSTVAQMGFMLVECALGLYTLAALHLVGHSLYKAHGFLTASAVVRRTRLETLCDEAPPAAWSLAAAPALAIGATALIQLLPGAAAFPWWWTAMLGLAWAPMLWMASAQLRPLVLGLLMIGVLTGATLLAHAVPLGLADAPHDALGAAALAVMALLYLALCVLQRRPLLLAGWRRWSYAGFYIDEAATRITLRLWPARWTADSAPARMIPVLANGGAA